MSSCNNHSALGLGQAILSGPPKNIERVTQPAARRVTPQWLPDDPNASRAASNLTSSTVRAAIYYNDLFFNKILDCIVNFRKYSAIGGL